MIDRIEQLRSEAESAIAAAASSEALEELRVRYLGRKAELPQLLRGVAELAPEQRGAGRQGRQPGAPGARGADRSARRRAVGRQSSSERLRGRPRRRHAARRAAAADRPPARAHRHPPGARRHLPRPRLHRHGGARGRDASTTTSTRSTTAPRTPRGRAPTPSTSTARTGARSGAAHAHLADAGARDGGAPAAAVRGDPRPRVPARLRRHAHAAVPPDRGPRGRRGHHARRPQGHAAGVRARGASAPSATSGCARTSSPSPSRASRSTSPAFTATGRASCATAPAATCARARAGSRCSAPARSTRTCTPTCPPASQRPRLRPREGPGLRVGHGRRADRDAQARHPRPAPVLRQRPALPGAVRDEGARCHGCASTATRRSTCTGSRSA